MDFVDFMDGFAPSGVVLRLRCAGPPRGGPPPACFGFGYSGLGRYDRSLGVYNSEVGIKSADAQGGDSDSDGDVIYSCASCDYEDSYLR